MIGDWLSTKEAAEISGYHPESIRILVRQGKLKARKWGHSNMISGESLAEYLESLTKKSDKRLGPLNKNKLEEPL